MFTTKHSTVAQVMGDFAKKVEDLKAVAIHQDKEAARQAQIIEDARAAMNAATEEAGRARDLAKKLEDAYAAPKTMTAAELRSQCAH